MIRVLFLIHDLGQGGAEKVLVNLVNNMDRSKFDISVTVLFGGGVNEQFLAPDIHFHSVFKKMLPGNSHLMKLLTPRQLHKLCVKECYDIEISYLEGPSARVISGCQDVSTKLVAWIHSTMKSPKDIKASFRNMREAESCYNRMDQVAFVSQGVRNGFMSNCSYNGNSIVLYNTIDSNKIHELAKEEVECISSDKVQLIAIGTLKEVKGYDRLLRIVKKLRDEEYPIHLYLLGIGPLQQSLEKYIADNNLNKTVTMLGYQVNPYKYLEKCDLFICSSHSEGFSTAATEALIVGTPVCTVDVSGMKEMLGENNEYGIVTENSENSLYLEIKGLLDEPERLQYYKTQAKKRGEYFIASKTVHEVENMLMGLI